MLKLNLLLYSLFPREFSQNSKLYHWIEMELGNEIHPKKYHQNHWRYKMEKDKWNSESAINPTQYLFHIVLIKQTNFDFVSFFWFPVVQVLNYVGHSCILFVQIYFDFDKTSNEPIYSFIIWNDMVTWLFHFNFNLMAIGTNRPPFVVCTYVWRTLKTARKNTNIPFQVN